MPEPYLAFQALYMCCPENANMPAYARLIGPTFRWWKGVLMRKSIDWLWPDGSGIWPDGGTAWPDGTSIDSGTRV